MGAPSPPPASQLTSAPSPVSWRSEAQAGCPRPVTHHPFLPLPQDSKELSSFVRSEGPRSLAWCHHQPSVILREIKCVQQNFPFELFAPGVPVTGIQALSQH